MSIITRPFHCKRGNHKRAERYIVWGGNRQQLLIYNVTRPVIEDITPHFISYKQTSNGMYEVACSCGVVDCGICFTDPDDLDAGITFLQVKTLTMTGKEFQALLNFKNTGYELSKFKRRKF